MKHKRYLLGIALVLATNLVVLGGVAYNRSGSPHARLTLTARELPIAWHHGFGSENTGLSLRIRWSQRADGARAILDRTKLESVGFDISRALQDTDPAHRKTLLPRQAYAVLEYDGGAWKRLLRARQEKLATELAKAGSDTQRKRLNRSFARFEKTASRLVLVDVGPDQAVLRTRYPDGSRYIIAKARVSAYVYGAGTGGGPGYRIFGVVSELLPGAVYVPRQFHGVLRKSDPELFRLRWAYRPGRIKLPAYQVTVAYGRSDEPWIESVAAIAAGDQ
ncbi:MAG: DUF4824 family protein [Gammaproteobacteria bacterium]